MYIGNAYTDPSTVNVHEKPCTNQMDFSIMVIMKKQQLTCFINVTILNVWEYFQKYILECINTIVEIQEKEVLFDVHIVEDKKLSEMLDVLVL